MTGTTAQKKDSEKLKLAKEKLAQFLVDNPVSSIIEITVGDEKKIIVEKPWGDKSFIFSVPDDPDEFFNALNSLILPERFTAIYHKDSNNFEVIWTAYKLPKQQMEIFNRSFKFLYKGKTHKCHFKKSSDRLLKLAENIIPIEMSHTSFRNLQSFGYYVKKSQNTSGNFTSINEPVSFWISDVDWNIDNIIELVNNLNFYLVYYDNKSPHIDMHHVDDDKIPHPSLRYISGKFPTSISGRTLDNNLLSFWKAASEGDSARRFQYYYRIIEYASFFYLESSARIAVRRILSSPDAVDDVAAVTDKLMSAFSMSKLDEHAKFSQLIQDTIDPKILWNEIKINIPAFSKEIKFDGDFILKPLISNTTKESTFIPKGLENFTKAIRDIRNALSHGRDFKTSSVIIPTPKNLKALQPWAHLIAVAAGQIILYKDVP